jgi:hypothetical protein
MEYVHDLMDQVHGGAGLPVYGFIKLGSFIWQFAT